MTQEKLKFWTLALSLAALWALLFAILLTPEVSDGTGFQHVRFRTMDQGGDGLQRHASLLLTGWMFGAVLIALFVSLLVWGTREVPHTAREETFRGPRLWAFLVGGLIYEGIFAMLCLAYRDSLTDPQVAFWGPFPVAVSWLLFGVWLVPALFIVLYVVFFDTWIFPPLTDPRREDDAQQND